MSQKVYSAISGIVHFFSQPESLYRGIGILYPRHNRMLPGLRHPIQHRVRGMKGGANLVAIYFYLS